MPTSDTGGLCTVLSVLYYPCIKFVRNWNLSEGPPSAIGYSTYYTSGRIGGTGAWLCPGRSITLHQFRISPLDFLKIEKKSLLFHAISLNEHPTVASPCRSLAVQGGVMDTIAANANLCKGMITVVYSRQDCLRHNDTAILIPGSSFNDVNSFK
eukprot:765309-Hanusia_phi.AAC.6